MTDYRPASSAAILPRVSDYNFDQPIDRTHSSSFKWELYRDRPIIPLWIADMDFQSPPELRDALKTRIDHGVFGYTKTTEALKEIFVERMASLYDWRVDPRWLVWLPGLVVALNVACRVLERHKQEVVTFTPIYPPFLTAPHFSGRRLVTVPLAKIGDRFEIDLDLFRATISSQTGMLLLCSPHNPVGRVFEEEALRQVAEICVERDIIVCSDEVHCDLILDPLTHSPTATLDEAIESQSITLMSPSKTFNLPGFNCAVAVIPDPKLRHRFDAVCQGIVPHCNLMGFEAALAAYRHGEPWRLALLDYLRGNRDLLESRIEKIPGLSMTHVQATYLAWIDARPLNEKHPQHFFEQAGVGLSNGRDFDGEGFVRLNFGCARATLQEALQRIETAVHERSGSQ